MTSTDAKEWAAAIPDPAVRSDWTALLGSRGAAKAATYIAAGMSIADARPWIVAGTVASDAAYLHRHHVTCPGPDAMVDLWIEANCERNLPERHRNPEFRLRANLMLAHPHLTAADRDAITAAVLLAAVPIDEIDHHITTGTYDRAALALLGALA